MDFVFQRLTSLSKHVQDWNSSMDPSAQDPGDVIPEYIRSDPEDRHALLDCQEEGVDNPALDLQGESDFDLEVI